MHSKLNTEEAGSNGQGDAMSTTATPRGAAAALPAEVRDFVTDIGDLITATTSLAGADLARARAKLVERASAAKASLLMMGSAVGDRARQTARATDTYVHEQPWKAIGIGTLLGLTIGVLLARRRE